MEIKVNKIKRLNIERIYANQLTSISLKLSENHRLSDDFRVTRTNLLKYA